MLKEQIQCFLFPFHFNVNTCSEKYNPTDKELVCPKCGGVGAKIIAGEEFALESIDVE